MNKPHVHAKELSMTDENADAWAMIAPVHQIRRLTDWANILEARIKEFDPLYRGYHWGAKRLLNIGEQK